MSTPSISLWDATKAVVRQILRTDVRALKVVPFSVLGSAGWGIGGAAGTPLQVRAPGADAVLLQNGVVAACVDAIAQAVADAPPVLERHDGESWTPVPEHPLLDLLRTPNQFYGASHLWAATVAGECTTGNAFWRLVWDSQHRQPVEIWWEHSLMPRFDAQHFISDYIVHVDAKPYVLQRDEVVHFRHALHPRNPRWGWTPLETCLRQIAGDNNAATYHSALLKNSAVASLLVSLKAGNNSVTSDQLATITGSLEHKLTGEGAGRIAASNLPVDISKLGYSPQELALGSLLGYYEARICAALRVPPMILGLAAGSDLRTYHNYGEALQDFWQRTIKPMQGRHASELGAQLLPLFGLDGSYRIGWDYSNVAALQDDQTALFARLEAACGGPFMTPDEARARVHLPATAGGAVLRAEAPAKGPSASPTLTMLTGNAAAGGRAA